MAQGTPSWLSRDFVQMALRKGEKDDSIEVIDIFAKPATNKGDNYASNMIRVTIEMLRRFGNRKIKEKRSVIIKVALEDAKSKQIIEKTGAFKTEISMMSETLPKMNAIQGNIKPFNARGFYMQPEEPTLLVCEDLAPMGFQMANRQTGLDIHHSLVAIRSLARFHACSVALCEKEPETKQLYRLGIFNHYNTEDIGQYFNSCIKNLGIEIAKWPEFEATHSEKLINFSKQAYLRGIEACTLRKEEFNVINHGDFWVNNMLFRYDSNGKVIDHIFVDFQFCVYGSPAIDLVYLLNTSTSPEVYDDNIELFLKEYIKALSASMLLIGCNTEPPTLEELKKSVKSREIFGMIISLGSLPFMLVDKHDAKDFNDLIDENGEICDSSLFTGKVFKEIATKRIPKWFNKGLLG